jgi:molybdopterin/thiamine biosynthesis adenylyltransferase
MNDASPNGVFSRIEGLFETRKLSGKTVAIVGLGTGGATCADELARCAVDRFMLVDFDRLEIHNLARHTCGLRDLGRFKTEAVADRIRDVNPAAEIKRHEADIVKTPGLLEEIMGGSDIILVCTDNNASRYAINEECLRRGTPAIYAGAYERAFGGMIMRVIPGKTPCYDCVVGAVQKTLPELPTRKGPIAYSEIDDASAFKAEPGLCMDVHMIALIQAKMALLTLLRGTDSTLEDFPADLIFWGNRKEWIFPEPLYCKFAKTSFRSDCPTCQAIKAEAERSKQVQSDVSLAIDQAAYDPNLFRRNTPHQE